MGLESLAEKILECLEETWTFKQKELEEVGIRDYTW